MSKKFAMQVLLTGINDYFLYLNSVPKHWKGLPEEKIWQLGWNHAKKVCSR